MNINIEEILSKRIKVYPSTDDMSSEDIRRNTKAAIKEIVEAVIEKCAQEAKWKSIPPRMTNMDGVEVDRKSILHVKTMIDY